MVHSDPTQVTQYLQQMEEGDSQAAERLLPHLYKDLRGLAEKLYRAQGRDHTLQPTALVHEAYMRLVKPGDGGFKNKGHFLSVAAMAMRQLLTDYARARQTEKRGGGRQRILLEDVDQAAPESEVDLVALDEALDELKALEERQARIVELRFFGGLGMKETAEVLGISERMAYLDWSMARRWLERRLAD